LESSAELYSYQKENEIFVQLADLSNAIGSIESFLKLKKKALRVGNSIRGEMIPDHELAVSTLINPNCSRLELTKDQAIRYLKREELLGFEKLNGWHWVTYNNVGLGWAKGASGRFKNHYPMSWRIQKQS
jgi:NOL1/NOP2/fmu family ribosome biogenesis protein